MQLQRVGIGLALLITSCGKGKAEGAPDSGSQSPTAGAGAAVTPADGESGGKRAAPSSSAGGAQADSPLATASPDAGCAAADGERPEGVCAALEPSDMAPRCGDGIIDPASEQCDGSALPATAPAGSRCSASCTVLFPTDPNAGPCASCAAQNCFPQRADLDSVLPMAEPLVECVLGVDWQTGARVATASCANGDLLSDCFCGSVPVAECETGGAAAADGPCAALILAATGCSAGATDAGVSTTCVAQSFVNPGNQNGKVMQYVQCRQDFCYDDCFNP